MPYDTESLLSLSLTIGMIVVLLGIGLWAVRRMRPGAALWNARDCAVLRSLPLGPRERLVVVRVGERQLVVGVGGAAVSLLCELDPPLAIAAATEGKFGEAMRQAAGRWRRS